jgi:uncharacterized integral membrane protein
MSALKWILVIIIVAFLLVFVMQNVGQMVTLRFFTQALTPEGGAEVILVILLTFILGLLIGFLFSGFQILAAKNQLRVLSNAYRKLKKELDLLRNKDIEVPDSDQNSSIS